MSTPEPETPAPHQRRVRYQGKNPRKFEDKYKEHNPERYADTVAKVRASGKTPAGQHVPIMVGEIMEALKPRPGERAMDCTLGYGGHATELLKAVQPGGALLGLDQDPIEIEKTEARLRALGLPAESLHITRINFAGMRRALAELEWNDGVDVILADLGLSSMQIDNPARGFTFKHEGPLDMRMNPMRGVPASDLLLKVSADKLAEMLNENADEPRAELLSKALAQRAFATTTQLSKAVRMALPYSLAEEQKESTIRRVFQALRIAVNEEFTVLDAWLRDLPSCLRSGGRVAVLTFHSGEDRRVKKAFQNGLREGAYKDTNEEVIRPSNAEVRDNSRAAPAKLRWAVKA